jgi:hypothetical protein
MGFCCFPRLQWDPESRKWDPLEASNSQRPDRSSFVSAYTACVMAWSGLRR